MKLCRQEMSIIIVQLITCFWSIPSSNEGQTCYSTVKKARSRHKTLQKFLTDDKFDYDSIDHWGTDYSTSEYIKYNIYKLPLISISLQAGSLYGIGFVKCHGQLLPLLSDQLTNYWKCCTDFWFIRNYMSDSGHHTESSAQSTTRAPHRLHHCLSVGCHWKQTYLLSHQLAQCGQR